MCRFVAEYGLLILILMIGDIIHISAINTTCSIDNNVPSLWRKEHYPNPQIDLGKCGRNCRKSWICDPSNIISVEQADILDSKIVEIASSGKCGCSECNKDDGFNISVALISGMVLSSGSARTEARQYGDYLRKTWSFQKCGNNVVIFISNRNRQVYTAAGPYAYNILTLDCIETVYNEVKPVLSRGDYSGALDLMLTRYQQIFAAGHCSDKSLSAGAIAGICFGCLFLVAIIIFVYVRRSRIASCYRSTFRNANSRGETSTDVDVKYKPEVINVRYDESLQKYVPHSKPYISTIYMSGSSSTGRSSASRGYTSSTSSSRGYFSGGSSYSGGGGGSSAFSGGCSGGGGGGCSGGGGGGGGGGF